MTETKISKVQFMSLQLLKAGTSDALKLNGISKRWVPLERVLDQKPSV